MAQISNETIELLQALSLNEVMSAMSYSPISRTSKQWFYRCPLPEHNDENASFHVDLAPQNGSKYAMFNCHGCHCIHGSGAISLICQLKGWDYKIDFRKACHELGRLFHLPIDGDNCDGFLHRATKIYDKDSVNCLFADGKKTFEYHSSKCEWTNDHIKSIGSWHIAPTSEQLEYDFGIRAINEFDILSNNGEYWHIKDGYNINSLGEAYNTYPVFEFRYDKHSPYCYPINEGDWFVRKYEPNAAYYGEARFTWWWAGNKSRSGILSNTIYGDLDVMNALHDGGVGRTINPAWSTTDKRHAPKRLGRLVEDDSEQKDKDKKEREWLFAKIVICSGPRDAINVFYHSEAHVVWPHSESTEIAPDTLQRLKDICKDLYVLYDIDKTGQERATRMQLNFPHIANVVLPSDLSNFTSRRTKKPCKDAADFFECYPQKFRAENVDTRFRSIDMEFSSMLLASEPIKFWSISKSTDTDEYFCKEEKYDINYDALSAFLGVVGYRQYIEPKSKVSRIVYVKDNIVTVLPDNDKEIENRVRNEMNAYINRHPEFRINHRKVKQAITGCTISRGRLHSVPYIELDFKGWNTGVDYLYFQNGALEVKADGFRLVPYSQLNHHVNEDAIVNNAWDESNEYCMPMPVLNVDAIERKTIECEAEKSAIPLTEISQRDDVDKEFKDWYNLNAWSLVLPKGKSITDMPHFVQFLWNTGFTMWREVNADPNNLNAQQLQFVNAQFISKMNALGYLLAQERGDGHKEAISIYQAMVILTDYGVIDRSKSNGRTGKSNTLNALSAVCNLPVNLDGKHMQTASADFSKNFGSFKLTVHRFLPIDDLDANMDIKHFYVTCQSMEMRTLYENSYKCENWESPKIAITTNADIKNDGDSTEGRVQRIYYGDYYHRGFSFKDQFGYGMSSKSHPKELQQTMCFLAQCLQFWHMTHTNIQSPIDEKGRKAMVRRQMEDVPFFCDWADIVFSNDTVYNYPVSIRDFCISYYNYVRSRYTRERDKMNYIVDNAHIRDGISTFKTYMKRYADGMNIEINPIECWLKTDLVDTKHKRIRFTIWHYEFNNNGLSRERSTAEVYYFYRQGETPSETKIPVPRQTSEDIILPIIEFD